RGGRRPAQDHGAPGGGDSREGPAAPARLVREDLRCVAQQGARSEPVHVLRDLRRGALGHGLGDQLGRGSSGAKVPATPRGVRALHADRGLPDHLRRAEDLARRPARRDVRAGGLREARPRRSRADHGGSRAQRPAARPVRALDARHHYGQPRQVVLQGEKVSEIILHRGPLSAEIGLLAVLISWLVGLPVGIISAFRPNSLSDNVARSLSILFLAIPGFWLGMLIVLATLFWFNYKTPLVVVHLWQD